MDQTVAVHKYRSTWRRTNQYFGLYKLEKWHLLTAISLGTQCTTWFEFVLCVCVSVLRGLAVWKPSGRWEVLRSGVIRPEHPASSSRERQTDSSGQCRVNKKRMLSFRSLKPLSLVKVLLILHTASYSRSKLTWNYHLKWHLWFICCVIWYFCSEWPKIK